MLSINTLISFRGRYKLSLITAIILGIFQGIAEFLPISSSGHLVILQTIFDVDQGDIFLPVMLHLGTLISIVIVFYKDIAAIVVSSFQIVGDIFKRGKIILDTDSKKMAIMIIVGTIPTGLIGVLFNDFFEGLYKSLVAVGIALIVTGFLLMISEKTNSGNKGIREMTILDAIIVGICQGFAIIPGISRSGSTIVGGLFRGFNTKLATKFSFLMAIPVILGATLLEAVKVLTGSNPVVLSIPLFIGVLLSAATGVIAIKVLIKALQKGKLYYFSYYVWAVGSILIISQLI